MRPINSIFYFLTFLETGSLSFLIDLVKPVSNLKHQLSFIVISNFVMSFNLYSLIPQIYPQTLVFMISKIKLHTIFQAS
jgi:hypothetical protein